MSHPRKLDKLAVLPDKTLARAGAVPVKVTARVLRADTGAPLSDRVHFTVSQRGLFHTWEPKSAPEGRYSFEPRLLKPGVTWVHVWRPCFHAAVIRTRVSAGAQLRLGTLRLKLARALPGTIGVMLWTGTTPRGHSVEVEGILEEGPAEQGGLQLGDSLLEIDGRPFAPEDAERLLRGAPGSIVRVKVRRHLALRNAVLRHVRPRTLTLTMSRAPGKPTRKRFPPWNA